MTPMFVGSSWWIRMNPLGVPLKGFPLWVKVLSFSRQLSWNSASLPWRLRQNQTRHGTPWTTRKRWFSHRFVHLPGGKKKVTMMIQISAFCQPRCSLDQSASNFCPPCRHLLTVYGSSQRSHATFCIFYRIRMVRMVLSCCADDKDSLANATCKAGTAISSTSLRAWATGPLGQGHGGVWACKHLNHLQLQQPSKKKICNPQSSVLSHTKTQEVMSIYSNASYPNRDV